jgi:predicted GNAT superfamily acetyltransferase
VESFQETESLEIGGSTMNQTAKSAPAESHSLEIRHCDSLAEFEKCVQLERIIWGEQITVPAAIFVVAQHTGGQILGAFDGDILVGFTLALVGNHGGKAFLHSHMTGVLPAYQNRGVGRSLKLFQREDALKNGISLVEWTFDPLEMRNAHLNLVRLGAVSRRFIPNCYGVTESELHSGLPTDRLIAEWWLDSPRVKNILEGDLEHNQGVPATDRRFVTVPGSLDEMKTKDRASAEKIQTGLREEFQRLFHEGYVATGIERRDLTMEYILQPAASIAGLRLPEYRPEEFED